MRANRDGGLASAAAIAWEFPRQEREVLRGFAFGRQQMQAREWGVGFAVSKGGAEAGHSVSHGSSSSEAGLVFGFDSGSRIPSTSFSSIRFSNFSSFPLNSLLDSRRWL